MHTENQEENRNSRETILGVERTYEKQCKYEHKEKIVKYIYIYSLLTYGCEAWTIGREASRRINAFEIWCYRRMLKISWINRTTNKEVFHRIKEKPTLLKKIAKRSIVDKS